MEARQIWWRKWSRIILTKMEIGQMLEIYYPVDSDTGQLFLRTKYFILVEMEKSEL